MADTPILFMQFCRTERRGYSALMFWHGFTINTEFMAVLGVFCSQTLLSRRHTLTQSNACHIIYIYIYIWDIWCIWLSLCSTFWNILKSLYWGDNMGSVSFFSVYLCAFLRILLGLSPLSVLKLNTFCTILLMPNWGNDLILHITHWFNHWKLTWMKIFSRTRIRVFSTKIHEGFCTSTMS